jgi:hypothetical protein
MHLPSPRRRHQIDNLYMTREDAGELSAALQAAFPQIRFVEDDYWHQFVDWDLHRQRSKERYARAARGERTILPLYPSRNPENEALRYFDSMAGSTTNDWMAWLVPPDWKPEWSRGSYGNYIVANEPSVVMRFQRSRFFGAGQGGLHDPPVPRSDEDSVRLDYGRLACFYSALVPEEKLAVMKMLRIVRKLTTNLVISIDSETRRPMWLEPRKSVMKVGRHAAAWSLQRRHNYLNQASKAPGFPYDPADVLPDGEALYARRMAESRAEFERSMAAAEEKILEDRKARAARKKSAISNRKT